MREDLVQLLNVTPGIVRTKAGVIKQSIDFDDWTRMLTMRDAETDVAVGKWVRVCKGPYKGDVGIVSKLENWGVGLLLVPRLQPPHHSSLKRKRPATTPAPALFDHNAYEMAVRQEDGSYFFGGCKFAHGLVSKEFDFSSISSSSVHLTSAILSLFRQSEHPQLLAATFPRPIEWSFDEGERVLVKSSGKRGVFRVADTYFAEVDYTNGEGVGSVPWLDLRKDIVTGDFVLVTVGLLQGRTGWVEGLQGEVVAILEKATAGHPNVLEVESKCVH
jgi:transcription elongation factor